MSATADKRYGRQGGRWLTPVAADAERQPGPDICHTCRRGTPRFTARHLETGESWPVCVTCRDQGVRYKAAVIYEQLDAA